MRPIVHEVSSWDLGCEKSVAETKGVRIFTKERVCEISLWEKKVQRSRRFFLRLCVRKFSLWEGKVHEIFTPWPRVCDVCLWNQKHVKFHSDTNRYMNLHSGKKEYMKFHYQAKGCVCVCVCIYTHIHQTILLRWKGVLSFILRQRDTCTENVNKCQYPCTYLVHCIFYFLQRSWFIPVIWTSV
jgi:hypothetical protein